MGSDGWIDGWDLERGFVDMGDVSLWHLGVAG